MPLRLEIPDDADTQLCQKIWEYCQKFGEFDRDSWDYDTISYLDPRDEEDAYKSLSGYLTGLGPGFYIRKKADPSQVQADFILEVFDSMEENGSKYGIVFETEDLCQMVQQDGMSLWKDVTSREGVPKPFSVLSDNISDIRIDGHLIGGVCCTKKWLILPEEKNFYGLMELERLRLRLIGEGRLKKERKCRLMTKRCSCT